MTIDRQIQRVGKVRGIESRRIKTASSDATLPLPPVCVVALKEHRAAQKAAKVAAGKAWHDTGLVITTKFGTPIEPRKLPAVLGPPLRCGGLDVHPRVAMQILRHANLKITMEIYTQVTNQQICDALKRLGESLG